MRIRLHGTTEELHTTLTVLRRVLDVVEVSRPYPDRAPSRLVRVYLTTTPPAPAPAPVPTPDGGTAVAVTGGQS
jgi:hypothetical protein